MSEQLRIATIQARVFALRAALGRLLLAAPGATPDAYPRFQDAADALGAAWSPGDPEPDPAHAVKLVADYERLCELADEVRRTLAGD